MSFLKTLSLYQNFTVKLYPFPPSLTEFAWNRLHHISIERLVGDIDVFHAWDWQQPPSLKAKVVTTIHDLTILKFPQEHLSKTISVQTRRLEWVKKEATAIIADSKVTKHDIINLLNIDPEKIHTVPLAASEEFTEFRNQSVEIITGEIQKVKEKYNLTGTYLLSVGTKEPRKNVAKTIDAFYKLNSQNLTLVIAGKYGWGQRVASDKYSRVKVLGLVETQNLPALYAGASALVYPSLYEGFGLPVLEAMSVGCPVVTSDRGSLKEVAGNAAVIVNPESIAAIAQGITQAIKEGKNLTEKGIKQAARFSWEKTAQETLNIYESLL